MPKKQPKALEKSPLRPLMSDEARQNRLVSLAYDRAEQQLLDGTASSQVITHFLKLGSLREQVELEKAQCERELIKAKTLEIQAAATNEKLIEDAIRAFKGYHSSLEVGEDGSVEDV